MTSLQPQNIGEPACAVSTPIPAAAVAYSYPPPPIITPYPSANGDVIDMSMMEASAEQTQHTQVSCITVVLFLKRSRDRNMCL